MVIKLLRCVVIYTFIRVFPVICRMWEFTQTEPPPFGLICAHHVAISLLGLSNAVVWRVNQKQIPYNKSFVDSKNVKRKKMGKMAVRRDSASDYQSDRESTNCVETTTTDYWISAKGPTPRMTPRAAFAQNNHQLLVSGSAPLSRKGTYNMDVTFTNTERDPESMVLWSLDDNA